MPRFPLVRVCMDLGREEEEEDSKSIGKVFFFCLFTEERDVAPPTDHKLNYFGIKRENVV